MADKIRLHTSETPILCFVLIIGPTIAAGHSSGCLISGMADTTPFFKLGQEEVDLIFQTAHSSSVFVERCVFFPKLIPVSRTKSRIITML